MVICHIWIVNIENILPIVLFDFVLKVISVLLIKFAFIHPFCTTMCRDLVVNYCEYW